MPILTIFSCPKPFTDPHIAMIQVNAIRSWAALGKEVEVFLVGEEHGLREVAAEHGLTQLPEVVRNDQGTPLVSSIFELARRSSASPYLMYINADIILLPDFLQTLFKLVDQIKNFLLVGQRWDLNVEQLLDFSEDWDLHLRQEIQDRGSLHPPGGSDYFLFSKDLFVDLPDFSIGRSGWDNWMIYHARQQGWLVVDGTPSITIVHQNHDYSHLAGGQSHYHKPETLENQRLAGGSANMFMLLDTDREFRNGRLHNPRLTVPRLLRRAEVWFTSPDGGREGWRWSIARQFRRMRRRVTGSL